MRKKYMNRKIALSIIGALALNSVSVVTVSASENIEMKADTNIEESIEEMSYSEDIFVSMDEEGNVEYTPIDEIDTGDQELLDSLAIDVVGEATPSIQSFSISSYGLTDEDMEISTYSSVSYGVAVFTERGGTVNTSYTDAVTGAPGYTNGAYGPDAAYLGVVNGKVKIKISGVTALVDASAVQIYEYDTYVNSGMITNSYKVSNGRIYHQITTNLKTVASTQLFGYQQSYMEDNTTYYSYDGHYFYKNYKTMITDYKNGNYNNAINKNDPYYNYYLFLSHRTKTNFTATQMNSYISSKTSNSSSKMLNLGSTFVSAQNTYGSNGILMFGLAINESAYGLSSIALNKNNLFGHGAVDSNPYYGSSGYSSAADSVKYHAQYFVSRQYLDAKTDSRYYGSHLGNKESGMNVKYASDPYWGEKAAAHCFQMEDVSTASIADYNKVTLGIVGGSTPIYNSPNGTILYYAKNKDYSATYNVPVTILGTTTSNGVTWYKIQSDMPVVSGRGSVIFSQTYNYTNDYAYVKASLVSVVNGDAPSESAVKLGDPSQDGSISSMDYILVRNHIMGTSTLSGNAKMAADVNEDGSISSMDYILIRNHIMGVSTIN